MENPASNKRDGKKLQGLLRNYHARRLWRIPDLRPIVRRLIGEGHGDVIKLLDDYRVGRRRVSIYDGAVTLIVKGPHARPSSGIKLSAEWHEVAPPPRRQRRNNKAWKKARKRRRTLARKLVRAVEALGSGEASPMLQAITRSVATDAGLVPRKRDKCWVFAEAS